MSNEIKVADVDQVKELFTALKNKMNSLKIIQIAEPLINYQSNNYILQQNHSTSNIENTYTTDATKSIMAISTVCNGTGQTSRFDFGTSISTTGTEVSSCSLRKLSEGRGPGEWTDDIYDIKIKSILLNEDQTVTLAASAYGDYGGGQWATRETIVLNSQYENGFSLDPVFHKTVSADKRVVGTYSTQFTVQENGNYLLFLVCGLTDREPGDFGSISIKCNGNTFSRTHYTTFDNSNRCYCAIANFILNENDVITYSFNSNWNVAGAGAYAFKLNKE